MRGTEYCLTRTTGSDILQVVDIGDVRDVPAGAARDKARKA